MFPIRENDHQLTQTVCFTFQSTVYVHLLQDNFSTEICMPIKKIHKMLRVGLISMRPRLDETTAGHHAYS